MNTNRLLEKLKDNMDEQNNSDCLNGTYKKLAQLIGFEATIKLHSEFGGGGYIPTPKKLLSDEYVHQCILSEYDGKNARQLAKDWDCTYSWILKLVKKGTTNIGAECEGGAKAKAAL